MAVADDGVEWLLTTSEVAVLFRVAPATVSRWAREGRLEYTLTPGRHRRFRESQVRALLSATPQQPAA